VDSARAVPCSENRGGWREAPVEAATGDLRRAVKLREPRVRVRMITVARRCMAQRSGRLNGAGLAGRRLAHANELSAPQSGGRVSGRRAGHCGMRSRGGPPPGARRRPWALGGNTGGRPTDRGGQAGGRLHVNAGRVLRAAWQAGRTVLLPLGRSWMFVRPVRLGIGWAASCRMCGARSRREACCLPVWLHGDEAWHGMVSVLHEGIKAGAERGGHESAAGADVRYRWIEGNMARGRSGAGPAGHRGVLGSGTAARRGALQAAN
jgi:hypothetical protein